MSFFCDLRVLGRERARLFGHSAQLSTHALRMLNIRLLVLKSHWVRWALHETYNKNSAEFLLYVWVWVLYCFSGTTYDVITFLICIIQKRKYLYNEKRYSKKKNAILLYLDKPFK